LHRFIPDPAASASASAPALDPAQLAAVKKIVRDLLHLPDDTPVLLAETACADAGCPLLETVIAVFPAGRPPLRWRLTRPRAALTKLMLSQTLATQPEATPGNTSRAGPPADDRPALDSPVTLQT
jgi:hypothetical protein